MDWCLCPLPTPQLTCSCVDFSREEHKKHSSGCAFLSVKKQFEELTLGEFLKLDKERAKNKIVCMMGSESQEPSLPGGLDTELQPLPNTGHGSPPSALFKTLGCV